MMKFRSLQRLRRGQTASVLALVAMLVLCAVSAEAAGAGKTHEELVKETIWQAVNLVLILGVLIHFGRRPIKEFFSTRREGIRSELAEAADLLNQAELRNSELQRRLVDLSAEVEGIQSAAAQRAEDEAERIIAEAKTTAENIRRDAQAAIDQELRRAQSALRAEAADLALEMAARQLTESVAEADRDRLIDEFITRVQPGAVEGANR